MQTDYLNDPVKKRNVRIPGGRLWKKRRRRRKRQRYIQSYWRWSRRTETEKCCMKKIAQLYEAAGRCDMAMDICIQGIGELKESQELKLMHIRFMCADPSVSREECSMKIKEYVRDDGQLPDQEEFKKLQKEYAIKMEGEEVWVGRSKKAITVVIAGMVIGSQFADMSAVGSIVQAETGDHREAEKETDPEEDKDENKDLEEDKDENKDPEEDKDENKKSGRRQGLG